MQTQANDISIDSYNEQYNNKKKVTFKENKLLFLKLKFIGFIKLIWDNKNKEFLMRNFYSWSKYLF
jgi:hypothetical protein